MHSTCIVPYVYRQRREDWIIPGFCEIRLDFQHRTRQYQYQSALTVFVTNLAVCGRFAWWSLAENPRTNGRFKTVPYDISGHSVGYWCFGACFGQSLFLMVSDFSTRKLETHIHSTLCYRGEVCFHHALEEGVRLIQHCRDTLFCHALTAILSQVVIAQNAEFNCRFHGSPSCSSNMKTNSQKAQYFAWQYLQISSSSSAFLHNISCAQYEQSYTQEDSLSQLSPSCTAMVTKTDQWKWRQIAT